jgi:hypothetical protein
MTILPPIVPLLYVIPAAPLFKLLGTKITKARCAVWDQPSSLETISAIWPGCCVDSAAERKRAVFETTVMPTLLFVMDSQ